MKQVRMEGYPGFVVSIDDDDQHISLVYDGRFPKTNKHAKKISVTKWALCLRLAVDFPDYDVDDGATKTCGFCMIHYNDSTSEEDSCLGCPVMKKTREPNCLKTPWYEAHTALITVSDIDPVIREFLFINELEV